MECIEVMTLLLLGCRTCRHSRRSMCGRTARLPQHAARESISVAKDHEAELQKQRILHQD